MTKRRFQFSTRHLLIWSTLACLVLAALTPLARHFPEALIFASLGSFVTGLYGVGVLILAAIMGFSISSSAEQADQKMQLAKCRNLALIGALMILLPVLVISLSYVFLSVVPKSW